MNLIILFAYLISPTNIPFNVGADVSFMSKKVERGFVEIDEPVMEIGAKFSVYGAHIGYGECIDLTGVNCRRFKYNEQVARVGYSYSPFTWLDGDLSYVYKNNPENDTHEINAELSFPNEFVKPYSSVDVDCYNNSGASYFRFGLSRDFDVIDRLSIIPDIGIGVGNRRRNVADFDCYRVAARDVYAGATAEIKITNNISLSPFFTMYDQFTKDGRSKYRKGFFTVFGISLSAHF